MESIVPRRTPVQQTFQRVGPKAVVDPEALRELLFDGGRGSPHILAPIPPRSVEGFGMPSHP
jgi:hypothetical protein